MHTGRNPRATRPGPASRAPRGRSRKADAPPASGSASPDRLSSPAALEVLPDIRIMGVAVFDPVWSQRWHEDGQAELLCVVHGHMSLTFSERRFDLRAGDLALVPPRTRHRDVFGAADEPEVFLAQFTWRAAPAFFAEVTNERLAALPAHRCSEARRLVLQLRDQSAADSPPDRTLAQALLHVLLLQLWCDVRGSPRDTAPPGGRRRELMLRARRYLDAHYSEPLSLDRMAEHLHVSPYYLSRVFSRESGFSVTAYLTSVRMERARERLRARQGNVSEVAYAVGYESSAYFSRVFKRHFGVAPSAVGLDSTPRRR